MAKLLNASTSFGLGAVAGTTYYSPAGTTEEVLASTEANNQIIFRTAGTASRLRITNWSNPFTGSTTFRTRKNTANGGMAISIAGGATGVFTDDSGTDSIAAADKLCYQLVAGSGTGSAYFINMSHDFAATSGSMQKWVCNGPYAGGAKSTTWYEPITGDIANVTTETAKQWKMRVAGTHRYLSAHVSANTITSTTTIRTRKNTANGNCVLSIGSTATGFFEDTTNSDTIADGDLIDYSITFGTWSGSKSMTLDNIASEFLPTNAEQEAVNGLASTNTVGGGIDYTYRPMGYCGAGSSTDQQTAEMPVIQGTTLSRLRIYVSSNSLSTGSTIYSRKNTANGSMSQSIGAGATGWFEDTTNSDSLATNDTFGYRIVTGTGTTFNVDYVGAKMAISGAATISQTKSLKYTVVKIMSAITKQAKYTVWKIMTPLTKSVRYAVGKRITPTKSVKYTVWKNYTPTKSVKYTVWKRYTPTKSARYAIGKRLTPTKSLQYATRRSIAITKSQQYAVKRLINLTKALQYVISAASSVLVQKTLRYTVGKAIAITKTVKYTVPHIYSQTKSVRYAIGKVIAQTKSAKYTVWKRLGQTKSAQYAIRKSIALTKSAKYTVWKRLTQTKGVQYAVKRTLSVTKSARYAIGKAISQTKSVQYAIRKSIAVTKALQYNVYIAGMVQITKSLRYAVGKRSSLTRSLAYQLTTESPFPALMLGR